MVCKLYFDKDVKNKKDEHRIVAKSYVRWKTAWSEHRTQSGSEEICRIQISITGNYLQTE